MQIPANDVDRAKLLNELLMTHAMNNRRAMGQPSPSPTDFKELPLPMLSSLPQGMILSAVERYILARMKGLSVSDALKLLHAQYTTAFDTIGVKLPEMPANLTLRSYTNFFVNSQYAGMDDLTDEYIAYATERCLNFYHSRNSEALQDTESTAEEKLQSTTTARQGTTVEAQSSLRQQEAARSTRVWMFLAIWILPLIGMYMVQGDNPPPTFGPLSTWGVWFISIPIVFWVYCKLGGRSR